jgi:hypothetical protein
MQKKITLLLIATALISMGACRTQKTGCPQPRKNWGAEKVIDELNKPKKKRDQ